MIEIPKKTDKDHSEPSTFTELAEILFPSTEKWGEFVHTFNEVFPMPNSYQDSQEKKLSPELIYKERKISCVGASILMASWVNEKRKNFVPFFLTSRKTRGRNHTHVYVGFIEAKNQSETSLQRLFDNSMKMLIGQSPKYETRWYHLNEEKGLHRIENPGKIPVPGLQEAMNAPIDFIPDSFEIEPPEFQLFTTPEGLEEFFRFDFKFRAQL